MVFGGVVVGGVGGLVVGGGGGIVVGGTVRVVDCAIPVGVCPVGDDADSDFSVLLLDGGDPEDAWPVDRGRGAGEERVPGEGLSETGWAAATGCSAVAGRSGPEAAARAVPATPAVIAMLAAITAFNGLTCGRRARRRKGIRYTLVP